MASLKVGLVLFMCSFCVLISCLKANDNSTIAVFDTVYQEREKEAEVAALKAYQPHPEEVTEDLNKNVETYVNSITIFFNIFGQLCFCFFK